MLGLAQSDFLKSFEIAIQLGAIVAALVLYWRSFLNWPLLTKVAVAFLPTAVIGLALYKVVKGYLLGNELVVLAALLLGGIALIAFERLHGEREGAQGLDALSYKNAALIGLAQSVAIIPGVSRSAATILGGLALNLKRTAIVEFSFLLAVPTMAAATGLDLLKSSGTFAPSEWHALILGFAVSFALALAAIRWLLRYVERHSFESFGWYRILVSIAFFALFVL